MHFCKTKALALLLVFVHCGDFRGTDEATDAVDPMTDGILSNQHRIFVSTPGTNANFGGIAGADAACQSNATAAGLVRTYKAILSTATQDAINHIAVTGEIYLFTSATTPQLVASNLADLWDGNINVAINRTASYNAVGAVSVWTGTTLAGAFTTGDCSTWGNTVGGTRAGITNMTDSNWINNAGTLCAGNARLYCISQ